MLCFNEIKLKGGGLRGCRSGLKGQCTLGGLFVVFLWMNKNCQSSVIPDKPRLMRELQQQGEQILNFCLTLSEEQV